MKKCEMNVRDPYILVDGGKYYMYGSRGWELWNDCTGTDVYVSEDLENWSGPYEAFTYTPDFWANIQYWAPEVHKYKGKYYMFMSLVGVGWKRGTQILVSDSPMGPFKAHSERTVTPHEWECLDGTFYVDKKGDPYMVFCHEWVQSGDGTICAIRLSEDLKESVGEPIVLFSASSCVHIEPFTDKNEYVTDGPFMHRMSDGTLAMIWSSFARGAGYCVAVATSDNGELDGKWSHQDELLYNEDGGHGMLFTDLNGQLCLVAHAPNGTKKERPFILPIEEVNGTLRPCGPVNK